MQEINLEEKTQVKTKKGWVQVVAALEHQAHSLSFIPGLGTRKFHG